MDAAAKHENRYRAVIEYANGAMFNVAELDAWAVSNKAPISFQRLLVDDGVKDGYDATRHYVSFEVLSITIAWAIVPEDADPDDARVQLMAAHENIEPDNPVSRLRDLVMVRYDRQLLSAVFDGDLSLYDTLTMSRIDMGAARIRYDAEPEAYLHAAQARRIDTAHGVVTAADIEQAKNTLEQKFARLDHLAWAMVILTAGAPTYGEDRYRQILSTTRWLQALGLPFRHGNGLLASQPKGVPVAGRDVREYQYLAVADVRAAATADGCWPALAAADTATPELTMPDFDEHWTIAEAAKIIGTDEAGIYERFMDGRLKASVFFAKEAPAQLVKTSNPLWMTDGGDVKASVANELRRVRYVWDLTLYDDKKLYNANLWVVRCRYFAFKHETAVDAPEDQFGIFVQRDDEIYRLMESQPVNGQVPHARDLPDGAVLVVRKSALVDSGATDEANPITGNSHKPNWNLWCRKYKVTLREAVCLSYDIDPKEVQRDVGSVLTAALLPQFSVSKEVRGEILDRLEIALSHTGAGGTLSTVTGHKDGEVYLTTFAEWTVNTMKWTVPDELRALASTAQPAGTLATAGPSEMELDETARLAAVVATGTPTTTASTKAGIVQHSTKGKRATPLSAEIAKARENAGNNRDNAQSVWDELVKLAEAKCGALVGYSSDGVQYRGKVYQETGTPDVFTLKNLRDRTGGAQRREAKRGKAR